MKRKERERIIIIIQKNSLFNYYNAYYLYINDMNNESKCCCSVYRLYRVEKCMYAHIRVCVCVYMYYRRENKTLLH